MRINTLYHAFLLLMISFLPLIANGQTIDIAASIRTTENSLTTDVTSDQQGNIYVTGSFKGIADFDLGPGLAEVANPGESMLYIAKYDAYYSLQWLRTYPMSGGWGIGTKIIVDAAGDVYSIATLYSIEPETIDLDPGEGTHEVATNGDSDILITRLDNEGHYIWGTVLGSDGKDLGMGIDLDDEGNVYIGGSFGGDIDFDPGPGQHIVSFNTHFEDMFTLRLNPAGQFAWVNTTGGKYLDRIQDLKVHNSIVYTTGFFRDTVDFDPGPGTSYLYTDTIWDSDAFLAISDLEGHFIGVYAFGDSGEERGHAVAVDSLDHVYVAGNFTDTVDFDPGPGSDILISTGDVDVFFTKMDAGGNYFFTKTFGGTGADNIFDMETDIDGHLYISGNYTGTVDFDPDTSGFLLNSNGASDGFLMSCDEEGAFRWAFNVGNVEYDRISGISITKDLDILSSGYFSRKVDFDPASTSYILDPLGNPEGFLARYIQYGVAGSTYHDINFSCTPESNELPLSGIRFVIQPGDIVGQTAQNGSWWAGRLPVGDYTIAYDTSGHWVPTCSYDTFSVSNVKSVTFIAPQGFINTLPCTSPEISINVSPTRRCFDSGLHIQVCNRSIATGVMADRHIIVELDTAITVLNSSVPYIDLGNNTFRFDILPMLPGDCQTINVQTIISCDAPLGQTLCVSASLFPVDSCALAPPQTITSPDNPCLLDPDASHLTIEGSCRQDSLFFKIENTGMPGSGDMYCYAPVTLFVDGQYILSDSVKLDGGESEVFAFAGDGRTWRLDVQQHPNHPGRSSPSSTIERCGSLTNWTPDLVNLLPADDQDPVVDIFCGAVTGSFDPNDKRGFPIGLGQDHIIYPDQPIDYVIRFQNTGNDTAFTVIVRDTIDAGLDIFSIQPGVCSHPYTFRLYGPRVAEWVFSNILLPDSTTNETESHGFITFQIDQSDSQAYGKEIHNKAAIYFDFNDPIITNSVDHTIGDPTHGKAFGLILEEFLSACDTINYQSFTYTQSGIYYQVAGGDTEDTLRIIHFTQLTSDDWTDVLEIDGTLVSQATQSNVQWVNCETNTILPGETKLHFQPTMSGSYAVVVTQIETGCTDTSACYKIEIVGNRPTQPGRIVLYPNPTNGFIQLESTDQIADVELTISDMLGRTIHHQIYQHQDMIKLELPAPGFYVLHINANGTYAVHKILRL
jgi:uncharacterized repeat protein (TIGR01451 family)